jgi:hypothetical protein
MNNKREVQMTKGLKMDLKDKKKIRFEILKEIYECTDGDKFTGISEGEIQKAFELDRETVRSIVSYLIEEDLLRRITMNVVGITHQGVLEIEDALSNPEEATEHFLPVNVINIGTMNNSNIMQGTTKSNQNNNVIQNKNNIEEITNYLMENKVSKEDTDLLKVAINEDKKIDQEQKNIGQKVSSWMGNMLAKAGNGAWKVGMDVASTVLTKAITSYYDLK